MGPSTQQTQPSRQAARTANYNSATSSVRLAKKESVAAVNRSSSVAVASHRTAAPPSVSNVRLLSAASEVKDASALCVRVAVPGPLAASGALSGCGISRANTVSRLLSDELIDGTTS